MVYFLTGGDKPIPVNWLDTEEVLSNFSRTKKKARAEYRKYIQQGIGEQEEDLSGGGLVRSLGGVWEAIRLTKKSKGPKEAADERILGTGEFVEEALAYAEEQESKASQLKRQGWDFKKVLSKAAKTVGVKPEELLIPSRGNARSKGRALLCKWLVVDLNMTQESVSQELGVKRTAVGMSVKRGRGVEKEFQVEL